VRRADADVGEQRQLAEHRLDILELREIAPGDPRQLPAPESPQAVHEAGLGRISADLGSQVGLQPLARRCRVQPTRVGKRQDENGRRVRFSRRTGKDL